MTKEKAEQLAEAIVTLICEIKDGERSEEAKQDLIKLLEEI